MNKKIFIYILSLFMLSSLVMAADFLTLVFNPFAGINVATFYLKYYSFVDAVIYLLIFVGLAQFAFKRLYKEHSKPIIIGVGLALTFAMIMLEYRTGFYLGKIGLIPMFMFLILIAVLLYELCKSLFGSTRAAIASTILVMYSILVVVFPEVYRLIATKAGILAAIINFAAIIAFVVLIIDIIGLFGGGKKKEGNGEEETHTAETETQRTPETHQTTQTVDVSDAKEGIERLNNGVNGLKSMMAQFSDRWKNVLYKQKNNTINADDWGSLINATQQTRALINEISNEIIAISNHHPDFAKLNINQKEEIYAFGTAVQNFIKNFIDFENLDEFYREQFNKIR